MARHALAYGEETICPELDGLDLLGAIVMNNLPPIGDYRTAIRDALRNPIASPSLANFVQSAARVAVIVNDDTRLANTHLFLPPLLEEIQLGGVAPGDITIYFANGAHRQLPVEIQKTLIGTEIYERYKVINHDCHDRAELIHMGVTSRGTPVCINRRVAGADRIILTGSIVYHFFAGYGGGRKALVPGVAGFDTIQANHRLLLEPGSVIGDLAGNPVHEDLMEGLAMANPTFLFNVVLNEQKEFLGIYAGDCIEAHLAGCAMVDRAYGVPLQRTADLVIASCGGHPKDINLYQAQKSLENAVRAVTPGGVVILLARCPEGLGSGVLEEWLDNYNSYQEMEQALRADFVIGGHKAYYLSRLAARARIVLVSELPAALTRKAGFYPASSLPQALGEAKRMLGSGKHTTYLMPQASLTVPRLPDG